MNTAINVDYVDTEINIYAIIPYITTYRGFIVIQIAPFDDSTWRQKIANYRQTVIASKPTRETLPMDTHTPYPYQRMIYLTRKPVAKLPLQRLSLPPKAALKPEISTYWGIHQIVDRTRRIRQLMAKAWADKWLDPFTYLDERDTPYNDEGGIDIGVALAAFEKLYRHTAIYRVELEGISNMYNRALHANAKVIYLESQMTAEPTNIIQLPTIDLSKHPRNCAVCGNKTSSGVRPLCDNCNQRFVVDKNYRNTPLTPEDVGYYILRADNRHRAQAIAAQKAS